MRSSREGIETLKRVLKEYPEDPGLKDLIILLAERTQDPFVTLLSDMYEPKCFDSLIQPFLSDFTEEELALIPLSILNRYSPIRELPVSVERNLENSRGLHLYNSWSFDYNRDPDQNCKLENFPPQLERITLKGTLDTSSLSKFQNLKFLSIYQGGLFRFEHLLSNLELETLNCYWVQSLDIENIHRLISLKNFSLQFFQFSESRGFPDLTTLVNLTHLEVSWTSFQGVISLPKGSSLRVLKLGENPYLEAIENLPKTIQVLDISYTGITDFKFLSSLPELKSVSVTPSKYQEVLDTLSGRLHDIVVIPR